MNELNELCKYARGQTTGVLTVKCNNTGTLKTGTVNDLGGFLNNDGYLSSSESDVGMNWNQWFGTGSEGVQYFDAKSASYIRVRPVRAF
jgi:hypothetical protein